MAEHGAALDEARRAAVAALGERLAAQPPGAFARAALSLDGWSGDATRLLAELRAGRGRDAAAGRALAGPHRADLVVIRFVTEADEGLAVHQHLARVGFNQAQKDFDERRFSAAGGAGDRDMLAWLNDKVDAVQHHRVRGRVAVGHTLELDAALEHGLRARAGADADVVFGHRDIGQAFEMQPEHAECDRLIDQ